MQSKQIYEQISSKSKGIFNSPATTYPYDDIILGCQVFQNGKRAKMYAVAPNTWRGFHTINKSCDGASVVFKSYFIDNKSNIITTLKNISTREQLDKLEQNICTDIRALLSNINQSMLRSYNKIRKPVDLYIEHIVSMASELDGHRERLSSLMFLPLDSQIFQSSYVFDNHDLTEHGLNRDCTFSDVTSKETYDSLQNLLASKAKTISNALKIPFNSIFFDLFWNNRYTKDGNNLFETNF